jgi:hypothetical protein
MELALHGSREPKASGRARDRRVNGVAPDAMFVVALIDVAGRLDQPRR